MKDEWHYESERLIINRIGNEIEYKIKGDSIMEKKFLIKKDYDFFKKFLPKINRLTKEEFQNLFIQKGVKVIFVEMDERDLKKNNNKIKHSNIICEYKNKYITIEFDIRYFFDTATYDDDHKLKNAKIDFECMKTVKGLRMFIREYEFKDKKINKISVDKNIDIDKDQIDIFDFIK